MMFSVIHTAFRGDGKSALHESHLIKIFASIDANQLDDLKSILESAPKNILNHQLDGQYAIHRAVQLNRSEILKYMLKDVKVNSSLKCDNGDTIWHLAVKSKNKDVLDTLFDSGKPNSEVNKQKESVLDLVVKLNDFELLKRLLQHGFRKVNLFQACKDTKTFAELVSTIKNINIYCLNEKGQSLLHAACRNKNIGLVRSLLMDGFDVNLVDSEGRAPIHMAIKARDLNMVIFLYTNKAVLEPAKKLWAPKPKFIPVILEAIDYDDPVIISYLVRNGANLNAQDPSGLNAIALALKRGLSENILMELIDTGSDPTLPDKSNRTALSALKNNNTMVLFIYKHLKSKAKGFVIPEISISHPETDCPICKETIAESDPIYLTDCKHYYHKDCLDYWLESSLNCPQCADRIIKVK